MDAVTASLTYGSIQVPRIRHRSSWGVQLRGAGWVTDDYSLASNHRFPLSLPLMLIAAEMTLLLWIFPGWGWKAVRETHVLTKMENWKNSRHFEGRTSRGWGLREAALPPHDFPGSLKGLRAHFLFSTLLTKLWFSWFPFGAKNAPSSSA